MLRVIFVDDREFTDEHWRKYNQMLGILYSRYDSDYAESSWEDTKHRFLTLAVREDQPIHRFAMMDGTEMVGWSRIYAHGAESPEQGMNLAFDALYDEIPESFSKVVAGETAALLSRYKADHAHTMTSSQRISALPRMWGADELNPIDRFRLYRKDANFVAIKSWLNSIPVANPELHLEFYDAIPEKQIERYCELFTQFILEMPTEKEPKSSFRLTADEVRRDGDWMRSNGRHHYVFALINEDDLMVAHSNSYINGQDPDDVYQAMTGVAKEYRGKGLSKWLKASMFLKVGEDFPDNRITTTDMRAANAPIQTVNSQMGFVHFSQGNEFEISLKNLMAYLGV